jgi:hypothetical protein
MQYTNWICEPQVHNQSSVVSHVMPKWSRQVISGLVALLFFAATFQNVIGPRGVLEKGVFIYILCLSIVPFLVVVISVGRSVIGECIGWAIQIVLLIAMILWDA